jgi:hypothetical protein
MTTDELNEARKLVAEIGLRPAARKLGLSHATLYRRLNATEKSDQTAMQQLVDALERYARAKFNRPMMPVRNPNWAANCDWIAKHIEDQLDSWKLRND